jgi:hypothetical protein
VNGEIIPGKLFHGLPTGQLTTDYLRLEYLTEAGPRLVRLIAPGLQKSPFENLFAEAPQAGWDTSQGHYSLLGGHRLWHAPEKPDRTSVPDQLGLLAEPTGDLGVRLTGAVERLTGIRKTIEVQLDAGRPALTVRHILANEGVWAVHLAPWAITMCPLGGMLVLPQSDERFDRQGIGPSRMLVTWPRTSYQEKGLHLEDDGLFLDLTMKLDESFVPKKFGIYNQLGWLGYFYCGIFFLKRFQPAIGASYPDLGCNAEIYWDHRYLEMETLGPLTCLAPGQSVEHIEEWEIFPGVPDLSLQSVRQVLDKQIERR